MHILPSTPKTCLSAVEVIKTNKITLTFREHRQPKIKKLAKELINQKGNGVSRVGIDRESLTMRKVILNDGKLREAEIENDKLEKSERETDIMGASQYRERGR